MRIGSKGTYFVYVEVRSVLSSRALPVVRRSAPMRRWIRGSWRGTRRGVVHGMFGTMFGSISSQANNVPIGSRRPCNRTAEENQK